MELIDIIPEFNLYEGQPSECDASDVYTGLCPYLTGGVAADCRFDESGRIEKEYTVKKP